MPRTEEEKTTQAPLRFQLGETEYAVKPLPVLKSREWRRQVEQILGPMAAQVQPVEIGGRFTLAGLPGVIALFPEKVCDLVFCYAPDLPKETILNEATEEQISLAFAQLWEIAFANFLPQMATAKLMLNSPVAPPSANSLN